MSSGSERIPTYVNGLDDLMQGGIPKGHLCPLAGTSGSMKSSLGFAMLYNAVLEGSVHGVVVHAKRYMGVLPLRKSGNESFLVLN